MANQEQYALLQQGVEGWNQWREEHPDTEVDLNEADLSRADLSGVDLSQTSLWRADLQWANLRKANLSRANLRNAYLWGTRLTGATLKQAFFNGAYLVSADLGETDCCEVDFSKAELSRVNFDKAILRQVNFRGADVNSSYFRDADLSGSDLSWANLGRAYFVRANLTGANLTEANLTGCCIYATSAWDVQLDGSIQSSLRITEYKESWNELPPRETEPMITVDNLKVAQFIYLLLNNREIGEVIGTIAKKAVLILGRFTPERKAILDAIREALRKEGYLPILFDFEKPSSRNLTETVRTLAHLSRFIIADLTDPSSIPHELSAIVPTLAIPVRPILLEGKQEYALFIDLLKTYHWVLPIHWYKDQADLLKELKREVIEPAEQKAMELEKR